MARSTKDRDIEGAAEPLEPAGGKGRPTPTRRERVVANRRPLVTSSRTESRQRLRAEREKQRIGMANGDERFLTARDAGPQRRYVRNWIDARLGFGEMLVPLMVAFIIASLVVPIEYQSYVMLALWVFFAGVAVETIVVWIVLGRRLKQKFGDVQKGWRFYSFMRLVQLRITRVPKPQVKIGAQVE